MNDCNQSYNIASRANNIVHGPHDDSAIAFLVQKNEILIQANINGRTFCIASCVYLEPHNIKRLAPSYRYQGLNKQSESFSFGTERNHATRASFFPVDLLSGLSISETSNEPGYRLWLV